MPRQAVALASRTVPTGQVQTEPIGDGWYHVAIGRPKGTKRFNLTRAEAAELVRVLRAEVLTADGGEDT
jgi:hypothetical protein